MSILVIYILKKTGQERERVETWEKVTSTHTNVASKDKTMIPYFYLVQLWCYGL